MLREPFAHFRVFVSGVVVNDRIDHLSLGKMRVDVIEETDELLMPVAFHVAADDGAVENVEGGEQRGCAVAFVIGRYLSFYNPASQHPSVYVIEGKRFC